MKRVERVYPVELALCGTKTIQVVGQTTHFFSKAENLLDFELKPCGTGSGVGDREQESENQRTCGKSRIAGVTHG